MPTRNGQTGNARARPAVPSISGARFVHFATRGRNWQPLFDLEEPAPWVGLEMGEPRRQVVDPEVRAAHVCERDSVPRCGFAQVRAQRSATHAAQLALRRCVSSRNAAARSARMQDHPAFYTSHVNQRTPQRFEKPAMMETSMRALAFTGSVHAHRWHIGC